MSLQIDISPQVEAQLFDFAKREGIDPSLLIEKMVREYQPPPVSTGQNELGGKTVGELYGHLLGTVSFEPSDLAERAEEYLAMSGFGETFGVGVIPRDAI
jgi:hypothetical protein